ncbi:MAG: hypothetical protein HUJ96_00010 [Marinilabiliaceae bacterium]|nr:hypothetical protein [Marinilabiliaceae bacterium]
MGQQDWVKKNANVIEKVLNYLKGILAKLGFIHAEEFCNNFIRTALLDSKKKLRGKQVVKSRKIRK